MGIPAVLGSRDVANAWGIYCAKLCKALAPKTPADRDGYRPYFDAANETAGRLERMSVSEALAFLETEIAILNVRDQ